MLKRRKEEKKKSRKEESKKVDKLKKKVDNFDRRNIEKQKETTKIVN